MTKKETGSEDSRSEDGRYWQQSCVRELVPSSLARALVSVQSWQESSNKALKGDQNPLLAKVHLLLQQDAAMVKAQLQAIPEEVEAARYPLMSIHNSHKKN